jgi:hypothetical protein
MFFLIVHRSEIESKTERWCILCMGEGNSVNILPFIVQTGYVYSAKRAFNKLNKIKKIKKK